LVSWDDPHVDWASFSKVLVSSTWDSVDRPTEYLAWAQRAAAACVLVNPVTVIRWCLDKVYLQELEAAGVPVIPTTWVVPGEAWESVPSSEFVVKPSVSAGGRSTARYAASDPAGVAHVHALQQVGQTVLVQGYLAAVDTEGEADLIFVDGIFSHAVRKEPALRTGQGVVDRPWDRMAWSGLITPTDEQMAVAERAMEVVGRRFDRSVVYGRVDLVSDESGAPLVLEVELIDPYLSLDVAPEGAARLAAALCRH
jgi:glutathione synthase/RimK-type ligase-like ATP-grasp enzyme